MRIEEQQQRVIEVETCWNRRGRLWFETREGVEIGTSEATIRRTGEVEGLAQTIALCNEVQAWSMRVIKVELFNGQLHGWDTQFGLQQRSKLGCEVGTCSNQRHLRGRPSVCEADGGDPTDSERQDNEESEPRSLRPSSPAGGARQLSPDEYGLPPPDSGEATSGVAIEALHHRRGAGHHGADASEE
jgi:hypothetical protein